MAEKIVVKKQILKDFKPTFKSSVFDIKVKFIDTNKTTTISSDMILEKDLKITTEVEVIIEKCLIGERNYYGEVEYIYVDGIWYKGKCIRYNSRPYVDRPNNKGLIIKWYLN